jgi:4'-phosphopantetheinyl transferase
LEQFPLISISITHSGNYVAAALCLASKKIGLDVERADYMPSESFMKIAFTQREIASIEFDCQKRLIDHGRLSNQNRLGGQEHFYSHEVMKRWTIKEAFLKYIGRGFNEKLKSVEVADGTVFYNGKEFTNIMIHSFNIDGSYLLSLISG